jgi:hypothetical protein
VTLLPDGDKPGYMGGEGLAQETLGMQKAEPHLNKELPALGIIVLLRENLAETGKDSEAVPGGGRTVVLRTVQLSPPLPIPQGNSHPQSSAMSSHLAASPQAARSLWMGLDCRADTTA